LRGPQQRDQKEAPDKKGRYRMDRLRPLRIGRSRSEIHNGLRPGRDDTDLRRLVFFQREPEQGRTESIQGMAEEDSLD